MVLRVVVVRDEYHEDHREDVDRGAHHQQRVEEHAAAADHALTARKRPLIAKNHLFLEEKHGKNMEKLENAGRRCISPQFRCIFD